MGSGTYEPGVEIGNRDWQMVVESDALLRKSKAVELASDEIEAKVNSAVCYQKSQSDCAGLEHGIVDRKGRIRLPKPRSKLKVMGYFLPTTHADSPEEKPEDKQATETATVEEGEGAEPKEEVEEEEEEPEDNCSLIFNFTHTRQRFPDGVLSTIATLCTFWSSGFRAPTSAPSPCTSWICSLELLSVQADRRPRSAFDLRFSAPRNSVQPGSNLLTFRRGTQ
ncbi:hypothetical protein DFH06DRAFT_1303036 [Mycena polygramma]|nr:hypothetical protein DFH06DRAFT_1303036 [Mycena polygramma]